MDSSTFPPSCAATEIGAFAIVGAGVTGVNGASPNPEGEAGGKALTGAGSIEDAGAKTGVGKREEGAGAKDVTFCGAEGGTTAVAKPPNWSCSSSSIMSRKMS